MFDYIRADIQRHLSCDRRESDSLLWRLFIIFFAYGLHVSTVYRFGAFLEKRLRHGLYTPLYLILLPLYFLGSFIGKKFYGIEINRMAVVGPGLYIGHFGGISVGQCRIGKNCNLHQLVTIGNGCRLGDNIWLGAHAVLEDGVAIADHATVMVGARVSMPVEVYCLVSGNPARVIKRHYDNSRLLGMTDG